MHALTTSEGHEHRWASPEWIWSEDSHGGVYDIECEFYCLDCHKFYSQFYGRQYAETTISPSDQEDIWRLECDQERKDCEVKEPLEVLVIKHFEGIFHG